MNTVGETLGPIRPVEPGVTLGARQYWGESVQIWAVDGLSVSRSHYPPFQTQSRHRHENPTYFYLLGGEYCDESMELGRRSPGRFQLLYHPAGAWHEGASGPTGRFGLNLEPTEGWLGKFDLTFKDLGDYRVEDHPLRAAELLHLATIGFPASGAENQILEVLLPSSPAVEESSAWFRRLGRLLSDEPAERWSLQSLANELGVHPVHLARVFRARYGCSVTDWLLRKRILVGAGLLMEGKPVSEAAIQANFADQSHFGRTFRAYFDQTPREFQRYWLQ